MDKDELYKFMRCRLKELREENNHSQADLADILGVHTMTVSKWERGITGITISNLIDICKEYKKSLYYFIPEIKGWQR